MFQDLNTERDVSRRGGALIAQRAVEPAEIPVLTDRLAVRGRLVFDVFGFGVTHLLAGSRIIGDEPPPQQGEQHAWQGEGDEHGAPAIEQNQRCPQWRCYHRAHLGGGQEGAGSRALFPRRKPAVDGAQHRQGQGGFCDAQRRAIDLEHTDAVGGADQQRHERCQANRRGGDHAHADLTQQKARRYLTERVEQEEGTDQQTHLGIGCAELLLDIGQGDPDIGPIGCSEHVHDHDDRQYHPAIAGPGPRL